ncbi:MAG TPA: hypothetical protein VIU45_06450 [Chitinophagaceae bacterium]
METSTSIIVLCVLGIAILIILLRWILRIDDIVFYLRKIYEELWKQNNPDQHH